MARCDLPMRTAQTSDLLQVERGMERIFTKELVLFVCQALHFVWQFAVKLPEPLRRE
jgi:hypothetical protein